MLTSLLEELGPAEGKYSRTKTKGMMNLMKDWKTEEEEEEEEAFYQRPISPGLVLSMSLSIYRFIVENNCVYRCLALNC